MPTYQERMHKENLAVTLKCILDCKRNQFKVKNLKSELKLDGYLLSACCRSLAKDGYLKVERSNKPTYFVENPELLKSYYEEIKVEVGKEFVELVLGE